MRSLNSILGQAACRLAAAGLVLAALAANVALSSVWNNGGGGDYSTAGNWTGGVPNAVGAVADFSTLNLNGDVSVALNSNVILGSLLFGDTNLASPGTWELRTDNVPIPVITLNNGGAKPTITVNPLAPTTFFDEAYVGHSLAGTMGFTKLGGGILSLGPGTANTITGGIDVNAGTLRVQSGIPEQVLNLADGTTLESSVTLRQMNVPPGSTATVKTHFTSLATPADFGGILGGGGSTLNLHVDNTRQIDLQRDWSGFANINVVGQTPSTSSGPALLRLEININDSFAFLSSSFTNSQLNLDNALLKVLTNSNGNTVQIGQLSGTSTAVLAGGEVGSAARYEIGGLNTSSTFSGRINGAGGISINKIGTGTLTLAGAFSGSPVVAASSLARQGGVFRVSAGTLRITGTSSIPGGTGNLLSTIDVLPGATFDVAVAPSIFTTSVLQKIQGGGTVLGNYNHAAGFIQPGDVGAPTNDNEGSLSAGVTPTAGTIHFNGNLTLSGGTIGFDMSLNPASGNDLVHVTGTTTLTSGTIAPKFLEAPITSGTYTVITSEGGFSGPQSNITVDMAGRGPNPTPFIQGNSLVFTALPGGDPLALTWVGQTSAWEIEGLAKNWRHLSKADNFFDFDTVTFDGSATHLPVTIAANTFPRPSAIVIDSSNDYTFTGQGSIIGPTGLTKIGNGKLTMQVANTFTGPVSVTASVDITGFATALGTGPLTLNNANLLTTTSVGNSSLDVPAGATSTIRGEGPAGSGGTINLPTLTGGGTLNITSPINDKWFALGVTNDFTGTLDIRPTNSTDPDTALGLFRLRGGQSTFPNAVVNMTGVTFANQSGTGLQTFAFGELHGDAASVLNAFTGGSPAVDANWLIGNLNTTSDFAGTIIDGDGIAGSTSVSHVTKVGSGTLALTGISNYTGNTTVQAGTLSVNNPFFANDADIIVANGAILDLNHSDPDPDAIRSLYLGGVPQAPGIYGVGALGASFFSGAGKLNVMVLGPPLGVPGDYNQNGTVDAADYTVWRNGLGSIYTEADYDVWKMHFGESQSGSSADAIGPGSASATVPEPDTLLMLLVGMLSACSRRRAVS